VEDVRDVLAAVYRPVDVVVISAPGQDEDRVRVSGVDGEIHDAVAAIKIGPLHPARSAVWRLEIRIVTGLGVDRPRGARGKREGRNPGRLDAAVGRLVGTAAVLAPEDPGRCSDLDRVVFDDNRVGVAVDALRVFFPVDSAVRALVNARVVEALARRVEGVNLVGVDGNGAAIER
jgi:hypothetical protein